MVAVNGGPAGFEKTEKWHGGMYCLAACLFAYRLRGIASTGLNPPLTLCFAGPYRLGPDNAPAIRIYDEDPMSGTHQVDDSGYIGPPLLKLTNAKGGSAYDFSTCIIRMLKPKRLILHPSLLVGVAHVPALLLQS